MRKVYQTEGNENVVEDMLDQIVSEGARRMLAAGLEEEVSKFLGRERYERGEEFRGYRNGYHPSRELTVGVSAVEVKVPRVSDVPAEVSPNGFESKIVKRYERTSRKTQDLFRKLYMEGLSTGDFEPVFRELVGETAALSRNAIVRLKQRWESEYRAWCSRMLNEYRYAYIWADGVYLGAGVDREQPAHNARQEARLLFRSVQRRHNGVAEARQFAPAFRALWPVLLLDIDCEVPPQPLDEQNEEPASREPQRGFSQQSAPSCAPKPSFQPVLVRLQRHLATVCLEAAPRRSGPARIAQDMLVKGHRVLVQQQQEFQLGHCQLQPDVPGVSAFAGVPAFVQRAGVPPACDDFPARGKPLAVALSYPATAAEEPVFVGIGSVRYHIAEPNANHPRTPLVFGISVSPHAVVGIYA